ncbi:MAG: acyl-CoA thioesterase [Pseudomonadota bacterium]
MTETLADMLTLVPGERADTFVGKSEPYGAIGIYGGHFLGQALAAAFGTVDEPKVANSFHAYFLKAGNPELPIVYQVERLRDGRGFDTRVVKATQGEAPVFHMTASFKLPEDAAEEHQKVMPHVPSPEDVIAAREADGGEAGRFPMTLGGRVQMELISDHFVPQQFSPDREPVLQSWMRVPGLENASQRMSQCALAYLADGTLMFNSVLPYGVPFRTHRLTSLDQSVWFHHPCDVSAWLMYDQRSILAADARGLNEGEIYTEAGKVILTAAQESMLRKM